MGSIIPTGVRVNRIYDWVPGKDKKNAGVPVAGPLWPRPPGPLLWVGGWENKSSEGQQCCNRNGGFPLLSVDLWSAANAALFSPMPCRVGTDDLAIVWFSTTFNGRQAALKYTKFLPFLQVVEMKSSLMSSNLWFGGRSLTSLLVLARGNCWAGTD